ncbi:hypothetical protein FGD77_01290 [Roseovarius sp. M141]|nr:hypothetical protein [Roseovarius sp. M141]
MALTNPRPEGTRPDTSRYTTDLVGSLIQVVYTDGTTGSLNQAGGRRNPRRAATDYASSDTSLDFERWGFEMQANKRVQSIELSLAPTRPFGNTNAHPGRDGRNTSAPYGGGVPFHISQGGDALNGIVNVTYSGLTQIRNGSVGEAAFTNLLIDFSGLEGNGFLGALIWGHDFEALERRGGLTPVPLPASLLMLLAAMGIFVAVRAIPRHAAATDVLTT